MQNLSLVPVALQQGALIASGFLTHRDVPDGLRIGLWMLDRQARQVWGTATDYVGTVDVVPEVAFTSSLKAITHGALQAKLRPKDYAIFMAITKPRQQTFHMKVWSKDENTFFTTFASIVGAEFWPVLKGQHANALPAMVKQSHEKYNQTSMYSWFFLPHDPQTTLLFRFIHYLIVFVNT
jgi:hypothetical protein